MVVVSLLLLSVLVLLGALVDCHLHGLLSGCVFYAWGSLVVAAVLVGMVMAWPKTKDDEFEGAETDEV